MGLIRQPSSTGALLTSSDVVDDLFGTSQRWRQRDDGNLPFTNREEHARETSRRRGDNHALAEIGVPDPLTGLQVLLLLGDHDILGWYKPTQFSFLPSRTWIWRKSW